jgi:allophycocyanin beta subunit
MSNANWNSLILEESNLADIQGEFLDSSALDQLKIYFADGQRRIVCASQIAASASLIIKETIGQLQLAQPMFPIYTARQYSTCIRDLDYFLRYSTYSILAGDNSILDQVLNEFAETYVALNIPIDGVVEAIHIMNKVIAILIGEEDGQLIGISLEYLCENLYEQTKQIRDSINIYVGFSQNSQMWEPKSAEEWLKQDKLAQQIQQSGVECLSIEDSADGFFEALNQMPYKLRKQVWREREIMAVLYQQMADNWHIIPGFISVSVAKRKINGKSRLVGILSFMKWTTLNLICDTYRIPSSINVDSSIADFNEEERQIPIVLEKSEVPVYYNAQAQLDVIHSATPITTLTLQSGDKIAGRNSVIVQRKCNSY